MLPTFLKCYYHSFKIETATIKVQSTKNKIILIYKLTPCSLKEINILSIENKT